MSDETTTRADGGATEPFWASTTFLASIGAFVAAGVAFASYIWPESAAWMTGLAGKLTGLAGAGLALAAFIWRVRKGESAQHSSPRLTLGPTRKQNLDRPGGGVAAPLVFLLSGAVLLLSSCSATVQGRVQTAEGAVGVVRFAADLAVEAARSQEKAELCVAGVALSDAALAGESVLSDLGMTADLRLDAIPPVAVDLRRCSVLYPEGFHTVLDGRALEVVEGLAERVLPPLRRYVASILERVSEEDLSCEEREVILAVLRYVEKAVPEVVDFLAGRTDSIIIEAEPIDYSACYPGE